MAKAKTVTAEPQKIVGSEVKTLNLTDLVSNVAQSRGMGVLSRLFDMGYGMFERATTDKDPVWKQLFSDKPEDVSHILNLIEENEPALVDLARSQRDVQLEPIGVWESAPNEYDVIFGMRRAAAAAYNATKYNDSASVIEAKVFEFDNEPTAVQLKLMALEENDNRQDESPIDKALTFEWLVSKGLTNEEIAKRVGKSGMYVGNYRKLLSKHLKDERMNIHSGKRSVDSALKLLTRLKEGKDGNDRNGNERDPHARFRLPGMKGMLKILDTGKRPKDMSDEMWLLFTNEVAREVLCGAIGYKYEPYKAPVEKPKKEKEKKGKVLKVKKTRAVKLLIDCGVTNAATYSKETLKGKLEDIANVKKQDCEDASLAKLYSKLVETADLSVEIVDE